MQVWRGHLFKHISQLKLLSVYKRILSLSPTWVIVKVHGSAFYQYLRIPEL